MNMTGCMEDIYIERGIERKLSNQKHSVKGQQTVCQILTM